MTTQADLGRHLDLSQAAVSQFLAEAGIERGADGYDVDAIRIAYIRRLREKAAGRAGDDGKLNLVDERAKLASLQVEALSLKNDVAQGKFLPREAVDEAVLDAFGRVRARLLSLPPRAAPIVAPLTRPVEIQAKLTDFVHEALAELAGTSVIHDAGAAQGGSRGGDDLVGGPGTATTTDGQPMGRRTSDAQRRGKRRAR